ncbi:hypothetical protein CDAR_509591 [Caerostris darwini]|uniref:Secreted protein n=1 Tax=Caerostris darwini TaxID=1538125 RepID=A0AAV4QWU8_9ARAC|nr:hypothetical protein CDAR_509591 [Caerostris darwini]
MGNRQALAHMLLVLGVALNVDGKIIYSINQNQYLSFSINFLISIRRVGNEFTSQTELHTQLLACFPFFTEKESGKEKNQKRSKKIAHEIHATPL